MISMIVALSANNGIGLNNDLPWGHISEDMRWFVDNTKGKHVLMGSKTWDSLPRKPLPNRKNIVLTTRGTINGAETLSGDSKTLVQEFAKIYDNIEIVVMGGANVYESFIPFVSKLYLTRINADYHADTFLDIDKLMNNEFALISSKKAESIDATFEIWVRNATI